MRFCALKTRSNLSRRSVGTFLASFLSPFFFFFILGVYFTNLKLVINKVITRLPLLYLNPINFVYSESFYYEFS
uniref:Rpl22, OrsajCp067 n=1 Tax=Arundo donax TaxID=35708 RepID=A0A0A9FHZ0_ARUDO